MKGLIRKRSAPASRLQRALSAKAQRPSSAERSPVGGDDDKENSEPPADVADTAPRRQFVMETAVQFTAVSSARPVQAAQTSVLLLTHSSMYFSFQLRVDF